MDKRKKISVMLPCYNEEENVTPITEAIIKVFKEKLSEYDYEILFIDNNSTDSTQEKLIALCNNNNNIKAIFNAKNFGQMRSPFYGMLQTTGDCTITMCSDFQDPPELIADFVKEWAIGYKIVIGIKKTSEESKLMYFLRSCYYKVIKKIADTEHIEHFTGLGLYDKSFINVLRKLDDPVPYVRGIVAELGFKRKEIPYEQAKRAAGKSKNNLYSLYDYAMIGITSYSKIVMRMATIFGFIFSYLSLLTAFVYLILKLIYWNSFPMGTAPLLIGVFFLGSLQLFFIGFLGEYILNINTRVMRRPLVIEERRLNFKEDQNET